MNIAVHKFQRTSSFHIATELEKLKTKENKPRAEIIKRVLKDERDTPPQ